VENCFSADYHQQYLAKNPGGYCGLGNAVSPIDITVAMLPDVRLGPFLGTYWKEQLEAVTDLT